MQNKSMIDIVTNIKQGQPDAEFGFYFDSSLKKIFKHSELAVNNLIISKQKPNKIQAGHEWDGCKTQHASRRKPPCFAIRNPASKITSRKPLILYAMYGLVTHFSLIWNSSKGSWVYTSDR